MRRRSIRRQGMRLHHQLLILFTLPISLLFVMRNLSRQLSTPSRQYEYDIDNNSGVISDSIPKNLVQSYSNISKLPPKVWSNVLEFAPGYKHYVFDDANATSFLRHHFRPEVVARFENLTDGEHKADLFRYAFLYIKGGVWLDADVEMRVPMDDIFSKFNNTIYSVKSGQFNSIFQAIIGSPPRTDTMHELVEEIVTREKHLNGHGLPFTEWFGEHILRKTGQQSLTTGTVLTNLISNNSKGTNFYLFQEGLSSS